MYRRNWLDEMLTTFWRFLLIDRRNYVFESAFKCFSPASWITRILQNVVGRLLTYSNPCFPQNSVKTVKTVTSKFGSFCIIAH